MISGTRGKQVAVATAVPPVYAEGDAAPLSTDLAGNLRVGFGTGGGGGLSAVVEWRVLIDDDVPDNNVLTNPLNAYGWFDQPTSTSNGALTLMNGAGSQPPRYREVDNRRAMTFVPAAVGVANRICETFRTHNKLFLPIDFRPTFGAVTPAAVGAAVPRLWATSIMAWCRKDAAGDASHSRMTIGFGDNTALTPSGQIARCGLIGDGLLGYRFGSVNCPDGIGAVENGPADIDANAVQPAVLVNPGANWFHVWIKMFPPTPTTAGHWQGLLNGVLATDGVNNADFTLVANFPRGAATVNHNYSRIAASIYNFGDVAAIIPGLLLHDLRMRWEVVA